MQVVTAKTTTIRTVYVHVVLNGLICQQNIVPYTRHARFSLKYCFNKLFFQLRQNINGTKYEKRSRQARVQA